MPLPRWLWPLLTSALALPASAQRRATPRHTTMQPYQTETFRLSASPCAAKGYPMTIQFGAFIRSDGKTFPVPSGHFLEAAWGKTAISWGVGDENQPAPDSLEILYFSYTEDKFYEGRFALPQQRLHDLLKAGFWDTEKSQVVTYDELSVCVLPKGMVVVWLTGAGRQTLVGRFPASESNADFARFYPNADRARMFREEVSELPAEVQAQVKAGTISTKQWDEYLKTYPWQVTFNQPLTLYNYRVNYLSAEYTSRPDTRDITPYLRGILTSQSRPVPSRLNLFVRDEAGHQHLLRIKAFDEAETQAAFRTLHQPSPTQALTLRVETDKYLKHATLMLTNGHQTIPLAKSAVEILPED